MWQSQELSGAASFGRPAPDELGTCMMVRLYGLHSAPVHGMVALGMIRFILILMTAMTGLLFAAAIAAAHPHVWVTMKSAVVYGPDGAVTGVRHAWTFDDMYSAFAVQGLESKKKGEFTSEELKPLAQVNVESLKEYDFFTYAKANGKNVTFVEPVDYRLEYDAKETVLTLHFVLPLKAPLKTNALELEVFDPSYFVDFALVEKDPVGLEKAPAGCQVSLAKPQEMTPEMAKKLAEIPPDGKIPDNSYGAAFSNKISVKCP
jgi:ABC-type uncharacterized transport system substrate-binding protein